MREKGVRGRERYLRRQQGGEQGGKREGGRKEREGEGERERIYAKRDEPTKKGKHNKLEKRSEKKERPGNSAKAEGEEDDVEDDH